MKKKTMDLFHAIGNIDDKLIENALPKDLSLQKPKNIHFRKEMLAACICLIIIVGISGAAHLQSRQSDNSNNKTPTGEQSSGRVEISDLLGGIDDVITETALYYTLLPVENRIAEYHRLDIGAKQKEELENSLGERLKKTDDCYLLLGHDECQYIIKQDEDGFTLWEFSAFLVNTEDQVIEANPNDVLPLVDPPAESEGNGIWVNLPWFKESDFTPYPYNHVLKTIYGLYSAEDIAEIVVSPADMDMTDEGIALQKEIGTFTISDEKEIRSIYDTISSMICYGSDNWERIGLGENTLTSVRSARYLEIRLKSGVCINGLKYTAIKGCFYEYSGITYNVLDNQTAADIEQILGI